MLQLLRKLFIKFLQWLFGHKPENIPSVPQAYPPDARQAPPPAVNILAVMAATPPQYRVRKSLCSYNERRFYESLQESVGSEYLILIKVRMGDIMWLENEKDAEREKLYKTQIWGKHVDFLLCNKWTLQPLLAIELDDKGHRQFDRRDVDEFKNQAFAIAKLPLLRVSVQKIYPQRELREQIISKIDERVAK